MLYFLFFDYIYLSSQSKFFNELFLDIQKTKLKFKIDGAVLCYIALILGLNYFILNDEKKTILDAFLLGLLIYVVYETTNYATLDKWPIKMVIMDSIWGGLLFMITFYLTKLVKKYFIK